MGRKERIVSFTAEEIDARLAAGESRTDWGKVDDMSQAEVERLADEEEGALPDGRESTVILGLPAGKEAVKLRIDRDVLEWFRQTGKGYQTRMNNVLRAFVKSRQLNENKPPKLTAHQQREALKALADGTATQADLARQLNISQSTVSRLADKASSPVVPVKPRIDADSERAARVFMQRLAGKYPVIEAILFGSRARGTHNSESDADIAVVLAGTKGNRYAIGGDMAGIAFDVMMETGILVEALPLWADELQRPETFSNPALIYNIQRDGLRL
jgi:uncharacterized protein (DUF4415 family)/predicted nucleotidyltransferase